MTVKCGKSIDDDMSILIISYIKLVTDFDLFYIYESDSVILSLYYSGYFDSNYYLYRAC